MFDYENNNLKIVKITYSPYCSAIVRIFCKSSGVSKILFGVTIKNPNTKNEPGIIRVTLIA